MSLNPLKNLAASLGRKEVLVPALKTFLLKHHASPKSKAEFVVEDARLTIATFRERAKHYNHGKDPEGEFFHPSALGGCLRASWYQAMKAPKSGQDSGDDLLKTYITFEFGTYAHVMFQNLCEQAGLLERREVGILDVKLKIIGHADGIVKVAGERRLLEIKTINSRGFISLGEVKPGHLRQIHAYMKALALQSAVVIYLNKDTSQVKEFVVRFDPAFYQEFVAARIGTFFKSVRAQRPPPQEGSNPSLAPCSYCAYQRVCHDTAASARFLKSLKP